MTFNAQIMENPHIPANTQERNSPTISCSMPVKLRCLTGDRFQNLLFPTMQLCHMIYTGTTLTDFQEKLHVNELQPRSQSSATTRCLHQLQRSSTNTHPEKENQKVTNEYRAEISLTLTLMKTLSQGCRQDPVPWWDEELDEAIYTKTKKDQRPAGFKYPIRDETATVPRASRYSTTTHTLQEKSHVKEVCDRPPQVCGWTKENGRHDQAPRTGATELLRSNFEG